MDLTEILTVVVPSIVGAGGLGALANASITRRKNDQGNEIRVREDLRALLKEERAERVSERAADRIEGHRCEEKVESLGKELTASRVAEAKCDARLNLLEMQQAEWRRGLIKDYLAKGNTVPPGGPIE